MSEIVNELVCRVTLYDIVGENYKNKEAIENSKLNSTIKLILKFENVTRIVARTSVRLSGDLGGFLGAYAMVIDPENLAKYALFGVASITTAYVFDHLAFDCVMKPFYKR